VNGEIEAYLLSIISDLERVLKITKSLYLTYIHLCRIPYQGFPSLRSKWFFEHKNGENYTS
jgi:ribonuclease G